MSVITRVFKWLGPIAIPFDAYEAFEDEPLTTAGMMHGTADFLSMQVGGVVGGVAGFVAAGPTAGPIGAFVGGHIGGEIGPAYIETATLGTWYSIKHLYYGTSVADRTSVQGIPDLSQYMPDVVEERLIHTKAVGLPIQIGSRTIIACPLGEVMVNGKCEPLN